MEELNDGDGFDYESLWNKEDKKKEKNIVEELPRGLPRTGIKGRYLKKKQHVGRLQLKRSWGSFYETPEGKNIIKD